MKDQMVKIGPCAVTQLPVKCWSNWPTGIKSTEVWKIIGPHVEKNLDRMPLWKVFCSIYIEGLEHGSSIERISRANP